MHFEPSPATQPVTRLLRDVSSVTKPRTRVTRCGPRAAALMLMTALLASCGGSGSDAGSASSGGSAPAPAPTPPAPAPPAPSPAPPAPAPSPAGAAMLGSCPAFPASAIFNTRIDDPVRFPVHASSGTWIGAIGATRALHADWGTDEDPSAADYYGIPMNLLSATSPETDWPTLSYVAGGAPDESDCALANAGGGHDLVRGCDALPASSLRFPLPRDNVIRLEGGTCNDPASCGDRHALVVEQGTCRLWESYFTYRTALGQWTAYSTAAWNLNSNAMRPDGWTSGDAAGLPIAPLLARAQEASGGTIAHALRVTFRDAVLANTYVWPARHRAGSSAGGIPFGALLRLKGSVAIPSTWTTQAKALAVAMQRYGLIVADIGSDLYVQGDPSAAWSSTTIAQIQSLHMSDFEFVDLAAVTGDARFSADSFAASW